MLNKSWIFYGVVAVVLVSAVSCSSSGTSSGCQGAETCGCYANDTCNAGLSCLSKTCVSLNGAGGSSSGGSSASGVDTQACLTCAEKNCADQASACKTSTGCEAFTTCWLGCGSNSDCLAACTTGVSADAISKAAPYETCALSSCPSDCVHTGSGGGGGGSPAGGSPGSAGSSSGGAQSTGGSSTGAGGTGGAALNLIKNGDFSAGKLYWDLTWQAGDVASSSFDAGEYCITNPSSIAFLSFSLGYPPTPSDSFAIQAGVSYTLSYRANGAGEVTAKIGQAVAPYSTVASFDDVTTSGGYHTYSHLVVSASGEPQAGLVFNGTLDYGGSICFDDVVMTKN